MMAAVAAIFRIDSALLERRDVLEHASDDRGLGFDVRLSCGHSVWTAVFPQSPMYCAVCLERLVAQIRLVQSHQEPY